jgi:hypothetical protein
VVAKVRTSWRRLPGLDSCGTRAHATSIALPISSAATRSTSSAGSPGDLLHSDRPFRDGQRFRRRAARRNQQGHHQAESRAQGNNAGPLAMVPCVRLCYGLTSTKHHRRRRATRPDFHACRASPQGHSRLCCIWLTGGALTPCSSRGIRSPRPARPMRPPRAGSPVPRRPVRSGHAAGSVRRHARRSRPWRCGPA